ncbi:ABC transporter permease [Streptomyces sp. NPDC046727]|uniref:ABC transporter permease n=1 Tax=Streptomyces sp. NPDC046727 TaxID=3155373 RepID=UPI0033F6F9E7
MAFHALREPGPARTRFWAEVGLGTLSGLLFLITLIWPQWIELAFDVDPDAGSGAVEWLIVAITALVTALCALGARVEWRRTHPAGAHSAR